MRHGIPRDLETIVLKATQADPDHRYRTAEELRGDLEAFLEDRPIRARRATALEHGWRWCRRNKLVAGLAGIALIAIVGAAITGWTAWATTRNALRREAAAADDARRAGERAEANLALARKVFEGVFDRIAGPDRLELVLDETSVDDENAVINVEPVEVSEADAALLEQLLGFYDQFAARNAQDADLRLDAAKAYRRVGDIQMQLRRIEAASEAYRRALATLVDLDGGGASHAVTIAAIRNDLGRARRDSGDTDAARSEHQLALELLEPAGDSASVRFERARAHEYLANSALPFRTRSRPPDRRATPQARREEFERAVEHQREAFRLYDELAVQQPDNPTIQLARVRAGLQLGFFLMREAEGRQLLQDTVARLEALTRSHPGVAAYRRELLRLYLMSTMRRGPEDQNPQFIDRAVDLAEALVAESPDDEDYPRMLATALARRAERTLPREMEQATPAQLATARASLERALSLDPAAWTARRTYIAVLDAQGQTDLALAERRRWLAEARDTLAREPEQGGRMRRRLVAELRALAREFRARGADADADEAERQAIELDR